MTADPLPTEFATAASTWQHLDDLVDEIVDLVHGRLAPREFWRQLLNRSVQALAASGGAVWLQRTDGRFVLECQIGSEEAPWQGPAESAHRHARLIEHVAETQLALSLPPCSGPATEAATDNPSAQLLLLSPVVADGRTTAILEISQRPTEAPAAADGYLRFLSAVCEVAADYVRQRQFHELREHATSRGQFDNFTQSVHATLDSRRVAYALANDGRSIIGCDRASVALMRGRKARLLAVSGVDTLNRRAASVRALEALTSAAVAIDEPLWYPADVAELPPQIERVLQAYLDESHARQLAVIPLREPVTDDDHPREARPIGALVCEYFKPHDDAGQAQALPLAVAAQGATALANALEYEAIPFARLWRGLGQSRRLVRGRQLPKTLLALAAIAAAVATLAWVQVDFTVEGRGELVPAVRRDVFAPVDGVISEILVAHGDAVREGQELLVLRRPQLELERTRVLGELQTARKKLSSLQAMRFAGNASSAEAREQYRQRTADEEEVKEQLASLQEQLALLDQQQAELTVRSPIAGQVLTWDVAQVLASRPIERGQMLLSIGDPAGPWELDLRVDDDRIGHVLEARGQSDLPLPVSFLLAMDPDHECQAELADVALNTDVLENAGPQVLITAKVDSEVLQRPRPGASVVAKIHCGRRSLGFVWLHDLWDAARTRLFF
ncbi:MAG TPA: biotin/lipoyl-binding protein [Pirellulales bacterium]|nr:biotin/lipoyl-binding protein [Pirellulales bacterium]